MNNGCEQFPHPIKETVCVQGIKIKEKHISESCLLPFTNKNLHKVFIIKVDIEFDGLVGADFLEHYECIIDSNIDQLTTKMKTVSHTFRVEANRNRILQVQLYKIQSFRTI